MYSWYASLGNLRILLRLSQKYYMHLGLSRSIFSFRNPYSWRIILSGMVLKRVVLI